MSFWVYILRCADGSYYTGHTDNLEKRIAEHHAGAISNCYTFKRRPLQLAFSQDFPTREEALASEQQIKGWSRKKKEAMMRGDWAEVSRLAKSKAVIQAKSCDSAQNSSTTSLSESSTTVRPAQGSGRTDGEELDDGCKL
jgi:putative endonuclease